MHHNTIMQVPRYNYLVRIINPEQRSKFIVKIWHDIHEKFEHASELKTKLVVSFEDKLPPLSGLQCGYLHKGSKRWIENDKDLEAMYKLFTSGDEIAIWCEGRSVSPEEPARSGRKRKADEPELSTKQADRIDELAHELYEKYGETYSMPQLCLWARMLLNKQYKSMDKAPPYPPFQERVPKARKHENNLSDALTSAATAVVGLLNGGDSTGSCMSPGKRARVSGQYLEHLEKLKNLHQSGVLSVEEFEEQKKFALDNIRKLNEIS